MGECAGKVGDLDIYPGRLDWNASVLFASGLLSATNTIQESDSDFTA
jgi:hypothetical protein